MFDIIKIDNQEFHVSIEIDDCIGHPWDEFDCHGPVRESRRPHVEGRSDKSPGERPLNSAGRNELQFYYDWQGAIAKAKAEGWNTESFDAPNPALRAVQADFDRLRAYLAGDWFYSVVTVSAVDSDGNEIASDTLGGVESDYAGEQANEMAMDLWHTMRRESRFADAMACGV